MATYLTVDYKGFNGKMYQLVIDDPTYDGSVFREEGYCVLEYPEIKDPLTMLRGAQLKIYLEANSSSTYQNRFIELSGDKRFPTALYENGTAVFKGYLKPDGIFEDWVTDRWVIELQALDGLGYAENTAFLNEDGERYTGNMSELSILTRCLQLTGQNLYFKIYDFRLRYALSDEQPANNLHRPILSTFINTDRFQNQDQENSVFSVKNVLESILKKYGACVFQHKNEWHIIRIVDFFTLDNFISWRRYNSSGILYDQNLSFDHKKYLGSQINGYFPHHAQANQKMQHDSSLGAYKILYNYGFVATIIENPTLQFNSSTDIDGWTIEDSDFFDFSDLPIGKFRSQLYSIITQNYEDEALSSVFTGATVDATNNLKFQIFGTVYQESKRLRMYAAVKLIGDTDNYWLRSDGTWSTSQRVLKILDRENNQPFQSINYSFNSERTSEQTPEDGEIQIILFRPIHETWGLSIGNTNRVTINNVLLNGNVEANIKGESHTAKRVSYPATVVSTDDKIFVGDNDSDLYIGAIEDGSGFNTVGWSKVSNTGVIDSDSRKLLEWLVRDRLQISGGNAKKFSGGIFGYLPYLGVLYIDGLDGVFMTKKYSWNTKDNTIDAEHIRVFTDDIFSDVAYSFAFEGGTVVKPTVI